ncbi:MAG: HAD hydrolase family protein [Candidatus Auribacterota bacterium]|jgi:3-deoxy-D-manno-octulosonate 8-phosphate phosphatase (KDO 8-P phosphatase)|nr:HAD hydrolase family protein [Candidatus Auribacterota bacterium]
MNIPATNIKLLALDVDGILTDGRIMLDSNGNELKVFSAHDGMGIKAALQAGIVVAFVTSRSSKPVEVRATELGVTELYQGAQNKIDVVKSLAMKYNVSLDEVCFMGDDLVDLQPIVAVGWGVTVPDAPDEIRKYADYVTDRRCGCGAVREVIEIILKRNGLWDAVIKKYLGE